MKLTPQQVNTICKGDQEIAGYFHMLLTVIDNQAEKIEKLEKRVQDLERQLGQNSNNSSKPPSSDGLRKPTNLRKPGGKQGAPKGHEGHTLRFAEKPDEIVVHPLVTCGNCSSSLQSIPSQSYEKRQVFDLPAPRVTVTEHRVEKKCCPQCGLQQQAAFPDRVSGPTQYGDGFAAWTAYLSVYQLLPLDRIAQLFADLTGYRPSEATLLSYLKVMANSLKPALATIRTELLGQSVVHADETGLRVDGKRKWLHTVSSSDWTLLHVHENRGSKGMDAGILPRFNGAVVHDFFPAYFKDHYTFTHVLCNAHLLRECQGIADYDGHQWATRMKALLQESWELALASRRAGVPLANDVVQALKARYDDILADGEQEWAQDVVRAKTGTKGRKIKSKAANLGERFSTHKDEILRFIWDPHIPFDNNQAERDIRMIKVKEKVSGSFRTDLGANIFAQIRSVISTFIKQELPVLSSLTSAIRGQFSF